MKKFVRTMNSLPPILKFILCLPVLDIVWSVARVCNGLAKHSLLYTVVGILTIFPGVAIMWLVDFLLILFRGKAFAMS